MPENDLFPDFLIAAIISVPDNTAQYSENYAHTVLTSR